MDVVGLVPGHHLVAGDAVGDSVHNGPLRGGRAPAAFGLSSGQFDDATASDVHVQGVILNEDATPHDFPGFAHALASAAAEGEIHVGLAFGRRAFVPADVVCGRRAARDEEDPHVVVNAVSPVVFAPAEVVQGVFRRLTQSAPDPVGDQAVEARAFIHFIEMREGFACVEHATVATRFDRGPVHVVENAFDQIRCRAQVFEALLVLNADGGAPKIIGDAEGRDVHLALRVDLIIGEFVIAICAGDKGEALGFEPGAHSTRLFICNGSHFGPKRGLREAFFENARGVEQVVRDDGVEHAHATLVKNAHNGFFALELCGECPTELGLCVRQAQGRCVSHMRRVVRDLAAGEPFAQAAFEEIVRKVQTPQGAVRDARFGERPVEVEHADQARPLPGPVGEGENGASVRDQAVQHMVAVLPDRLGHDEGRVGMNMFEDSHALFLRADKAVSLIWLVGMPAADSPSLALNRGSDGFFHGLLCGPTHLIGGQAQVPIGDEHDLVFSRCFGFGEFGKCVCHNTLLFRWLKQKATPRPMRLRNF